MRVYRSDIVFLRSAEAKLLRSVHRFDEPTGLSLSMVAPPQCRFRFARQNDSSAAATGAANFRVARYTPETASQAPNPRPRDRPPSAASGGSQRHVDLSLGVGPAAMPPMPAGQSLEQKGGAG